MASSKVFSSDHEEDNVDWDARRASVDDYLRIIQPKIDEALLGVKSKLTPVMSTRALRKLNERRKRMVAAFMEEFAENSIWFPRYGSDEWVNAMIKHFRDPPATRILPQDVKNWMRCEPFFEVINEVYGYLQPAELEPDSATLSGSDYTNLYRKADIKVSGGDIKVRTALRRLNGRRLQMIKEFMEEFEANHQKYAAYGSEDWITSMIEYFRDPRSTRILTQDVKHWLATEPFFEDINKRYEYCPKREPYCTPVKQEIVCKKEETETETIPMIGVDDGDDDVDEVICLD